MGQMGHVALGCALAAMFAGCAGESDGARLNPAVQAQALEVDTDPRASVGDRYIVTMRDAAKGAAQRTSAPVTRV